MRKVVRILCIFVFFVQCGGSLANKSPENGSPGSQEDFEPGSNQDISNTTPFDSLQSGDDFEWGKFIRAPYQTTSITSLPLTIYLAFFTPSEKEIIEEGITIANQAIGFNLFEIITEWNPEARIIYKVNKIDFPESNKDDGDFSNVVGYTYSRNIYINELYEAGRVILDWAIEIRSDRINKWIVAHELGHAVGIQKHALINYDNDSTEGLEDNSLMSAIISYNPTLDDYNFMMKRQGEILLDYLESIGQTF